MLTVCQPLGTPLVVRGLPLGSAEAHPETSQPSFWAWNSKKTDHQKARPSVPTRHFTRRCDGFLEVDLSPHSSRSHYATASNRMAAETSGRVGRTSDAGTFSGESGGSNAVSDWRRNWLGQRLKGRAPNGYSQAKREQWRVFKEEELREVDWERFERTATISRSAGDTASPAIAALMEDMARVDGAGHVACDIPLRERVPVYVMLPLDTIMPVDGGAARLARAKTLAASLDALWRVGVDGVMVDVWWGIVEAEGPGVYDWSAYKQLVRLVEAAGLKLQVVMSFHACGLNVGDSGTCIGLPPWVLQRGLWTPGIFYTDRGGQVSREYISLGADHERLLFGRTPVECYRDLIQSFVAEMRPHLGNTISEITVGLGPAGELRYPSYPGGDGRWQFPGIGEFQCYDKYMLSDLRRAAIAAGHPEWGGSGPHDAGHYNSRPWETPFFECSWGSFASDYGHFFLDWYSSKLIEHGDTILGAASQVLREEGVSFGLGQDRQLHLGAKIAGVHWWYRSRSHAAELTAGYYNTWHRDGYRPIADMLARHSAAINFTCVEMHDSEHPDHSFCSPQGLLQQMQNAAGWATIPLAGENALQRYDDRAFDRIVANTYSSQQTMRAFTFLRMGEALFHTHNWRAFLRFLRHMCTKAADGRPGGLGGGAVAGRVPAGGGAQRLVPGGQARCALGTQAEMSEGVLN